MIYNAFTAVCAFLLYLWWSWTLRRGTDLQPIPHRQPASDITAEELDTWQRLSDAALEQAAERERKWIDEIEAQITDREQDA